MSSQDKAALERALFDVGRAVDYPVTPALAESVGERLRVARPSRLERVQRPWLRAAWVAAIVLVLVAAVLVVSPAARHAVADWLGISGVRIERPEEAPPAPSTSREGLGLGPETTLEEAARDLDFPTEVPAVLPAPDSVHVSATRPVGETLTLAYEATKDLPESENTGWGLLVIQFRAELDEVLMQKIATQGSVRVVPVDLGDGGYWISGDPHLVFVLDEFGNVKEDEVRLAGNVLLWEDDGVSYRIEADISKARALGIARSMMRPWS